MDSFGIPTHESHKSSSLPKHERAISRMRSMVVTLPQFQEWKKKRPKKKAAPASSSASASGSASASSSPEDIEQEVKRKRRRGAPVPDAPDNQGQGDADKSEVDPSTAKAMETVALLKVKEGKKGKGTDKNDAPCADCQAWWSCWQETILKDTMSEWAACDVCNNWFCPACRTTAQVIEHEAECAKSSTKMPRK